MGTRTSDRAPAKPKRRAKAAASSRDATPGPAAHIKPAPKGPRTVSHRRIVEAVEKVFRERNMTHA